MLNNKIYNVVNKQQIIFKKKKKSNPEQTVTWSTNAVQIRLCIFGEVKVDDYIDSLDVNSSCEKICEGKDPIKKVS